MLKEGNFVSEGFYFLNVVDFNGVEFVDDFGWGFWFVKKGGVLVIRNGRGVVLYDKLVDGFLEGGFWDVGIGIRI